MNITSLMSRHFRRLVLAALITGFAAPVAPKANAGPVIKWRVENPFRFFTDPADSEVHRATYRALSPDEKRKRSEAHFRRKDEARGRSRLADFAEKLRPDEVNRQSFEFRPARFRLTHRHSQT